MNLHEQIHRDVIQSLKSGATEAGLNNALRLLAKYRSLLIQNTFLKIHGPTVMSGPFAGMKFIAESTEGCHLPKLLGCYEEELHAFLKELPNAGYDAIINIGCAEGYYAVGIKRLLPNVRVIGYDRNPLALRTCKTVAEKNQVEIETAGEFRAGDLDNFVGKKVLVWCDIEGAEIELLDPGKSPALVGMDLVVELHSTAAGNASEILPQRFASSHHIELVKNDVHKPVLPEFLRNLGHLDQLLAQWEWRSAPTPWAIMRAKSPSGIGADAR
jgi:hypothetical protein